MNVRPGATLYLVSLFILILEQSSAWADHGGVSLGGEVKPLVDEAITTITFVCPGPRCFLPCCDAVVASDPRLPRRGHPPSSQADRVVLAQVQPPGAGAAGPGAPAQGRDV